jgi:hypothetical protein
VAGWCVKRIFLAELRGDEAWKYVGSANTGHPGSITTTHANNALQTYQRMGTLIKQSEVGLALDQDMINRTLYSTSTWCCTSPSASCAKCFTIPCLPKSKCVDGKPRPAGLFALRGKPNPVPQVDRPNLPLLQQSLY